MKIFLKRMFIGLISGLFAGSVIIGFGGRVAMRLIARLGGRSGGFSWGGTMEIIALGLIIGIISGLIYGLIEKYVFTNRFLKGLVFGALVFAVVLVLPLDGKGAAKGFPDLKTQVYLIFGSVFLVYGLALAFTYDWWARRPIFARIFRNKDL